MNKRTGFSRWCVWIVGLWCGCHGQGEWIPIQDKDGIQVSKRPYPGSPLQQLRAVGKIHADMPKLVRLLTDVSGQTKWIPLCVEARTVEGALGGAQRIYRKFDNPWPFQDIDYVVDQTVKTVAATGETLVEFAEVSGAYPVQECCGRMREFRGAWSLRNAGAGWVEVTYTLHLVPSGGTPAVFLNASLGKIGWDTFDALRRAARLGNKPEAVAAPRREPLHTEPRATPRWTSPPPISMFDA